MIVGTSTSCSASCGSRTGVRTESSSMRILGTSITCSGTWISCGAKTSTNSCSSISGTGTSNISEGMICSTVCRWTRSCGLTSESRSGREPRRQVSAVHLPPAGELLRIVAVKFNSYSSPGLAVFWPLWWQGPWRRSSARAARMSGGVALSAGRHCRCRRLHRHVQPRLTYRYGSNKKGYQKQRKPV